MAQQTYYGKVTYSDGAAHNWYGTKLVIRDEAVASSNTSKVYWDYYVWMASASLTPYKYKYGNKLYIAFGDIVIVDTANYGTHDPTGHIGEDNALLYASGSTVIAHDEDGTKTFAVTLQYEQTQSSTLDKVTISDTYTCTPIERSTSITASSGVLGEKQTITLNRHSAKYTDTISYYLNSVYMGTIAEKTSDTLIEWTPPLDIAYELTDAETFGITYKATTYDGDTVVGTSTYLVIMMLPLSITPILSADNITVSPHQYYDVLSDYNGYVAGKTGAKVSIPYIKGDEYGATITDVAIEYDGLTKHFSSLPLVEGFVTDLSEGNAAIKCTITNSRGRSATATAIINVEPYTKPQILNLTARRCNIQGEVMPNGMFLLLDGTPSISVYGTNSYVITTSIGTANIELLPAIIGGALSPANSYTVDVIIRDSLGEYSLQTLNIPDESIPLYVKPNGKAMGLGAYALDDGTLNIGYKMLLDGVPFGSDITIKTGTVTLGETTSTCHYIKTSSVAIVFINTGYLSAAAGGSVLTLPEELKGFTSSSTGVGVVWATGSFYANVTLSPNSTTNSVTIYAAAGSVMEIGLGRMLIGHFILNYS